jgi:uncharacterized protein (DUF983 family)
MTEHRHYSPQEPMVTGMRGLCPRCGKGHLFSSFIKLAPRCEVCGLDNSFADPADGPAFFSLMIVSFPILGLIWWFDAHYEPALWVHLLTSLPFMLVACLLPLRPLKGWLVCSQYYHKAEEGRLAARDRP